MNDNPSSDFTRFAGCGLALAAIIAALALLIFALAYAGYIGTPGAGWSSGMMRNSGVMPMQNLSGTMPMQGMPGNMPMQGMPGAGMMTAAAGAAAATSAAASAPQAQSGTTGAAATASGTAYPGRAGTPGTADVGTSGDALVVEDWRGYADDEALVDAYSFNTAVPDNNLELRLQTTTIPGGPVSAIAAYSITAPAPNDYVGFDRSLGTAEDWSDFTHLSVRAEPGAQAAGQLVVQWYEASGEVWRHRTNFADIPADGRLLIPLTADAWEWADWSDKRNQELDLDAVVNLGIFMGHAGPGSGTVEFGTIEVVKEP